MVVAREECRGHVQNTKWRSTGAVGTCDWIFHSTFYRLTHAGFLIRIIQHDDEVGVVWRRQTCEVVTNMITKVRKQVFFSRRSLKASWYSLGWTFIHTLTLILRRSRTGTVWFYTSTSNKRAARPKLYTTSLTRDLKLMYSRLTLVRISINL